MEDKAIKASSGRERRLSAGLYVLATPLGNLGDVTLRALETLREADTIACEDTRVTRDLLRLLSIEPPPLISVREHNERAQSNTVISRIAAGEVVVYVSDAGTPAISDPGARIVDAVRLAGQSVIPIPGVSAVTAALSVCGFERTAFSFLGFAPTTEKALAEFIESMRDATANSVFFESPHRAEKTFVALSAQLPADRRVMIGRELTKKFETILVLPAADLSRWADENSATLRGEFVLIVEGAVESNRVMVESAVDARSLLKALMTELPAAKAAKIAAQITGAPRQTLFDLATELKGGTDK